MTFDNTTTLNQYAHRQQINLRVRHVQRRQDWRDAEHFLLAIVIGAAVVAWTVVFIRWFV